MPIVPGEPPHGRGRPKTPALAAKFAGSGGAIVGLYQDGRQYQQLCDALAGIRCTVFRPTIFG